MLNVRCDICLRAKITDASHTGQLYRATRPWRTFSFDVTGPFAAASIHGNYYQSAMMDTCSAMVYGDYLKNKDEAHDVLSCFFDTEIVALRGRDTTEFEIILMSDCAAHTNKIIKLCRKHGILKQSTAGYTPQHNAFVERWFRTVGEMSRSQLLQFDMEEEFWEDSRRHATWLYNRVPPSRYVPGEPWLSPIQKQYPERKVTDLTQLHPFGTECWTHIKKARRPNKSDGNPRGQHGILVGYDDEQGPLLARVYFPDTGIFELHDNSYMVYQDFNIQCHSLGLHDAAEEPQVRPVEFYHPLIGTRHVDPQNGLTYETVDIKVTPQRDIVAWRRRVMNGVVVDAPQGPLHVDTIHQYTQDTLLNGMDKRQSDETTPSGISPRVRGKRPRDPDGSNGVSLARGDIPGLEDIISPNTIGSLQGLQQQQQFRISPAMEKATTMEAPKAARIEQTHKYPTRYTKRTTMNYTDASGSRERYTAATHLASAIKSDNLFTMMAIEEIAESIDALADNNNVKDPTSEDYIPPNRKLMLKCTHRT